jgi:rhomboid protease GluP
MSTTDEPEPAPSAGDASRISKPIEEPAPVAASDDDVEATAKKKRKKKRVEKAEAGAAPAAAESAEAGPEPFARYLARVTCVEKGYRPGTAREAAELADACDLVLTYADGMSFVILCIIDAERDPRRRFDLDLDHVIEIGRACLQFTGSMNGTKLPVGIRIVEIRDEITEADKQRLEGYHRRPGLKKVAVNGFLLSPRSGQVWSTLLFGWLEEGRYRRMLTGTRRTAADLDAPAPALAAPSGPPWLTCAILAALALVFVVELSVGARPGAEFLTPPIDTLVALGGASGALVQGQGEWWRLFTATLLHGGPLHLLLNGVGLFLGGVVLEGLLGRAWLGALFVLGALGGSIASVLINDPGTVSVGASGAIMGLLAAAMVATYRLPPAHRAPLQMPLVQMLVPSLIPLTFQRSGGHIDFAAHIGGALTGLLAGLALLRTWPAADPHPRFRRAAAGVALAGAAAYLISFAEVKGAYALYAGAGEVELIPNERLSSLTSKDVPDVLARYPRDPRSHQLAAIKAAQENDLPLAEKHLRLALAEEGVLRSAFPDRLLEGDLRILLGRVLEANGRDAEAREIARPVCDLERPKLEKFCK